MSEDERKSFQRRFYDATAVLQGNFYPTIIENHLDEQNEEEYDGAKSESDVKRKDFRNGVFSDIFENGAESSGEEDGDRGE